jgi:uncharacterized membrane protein YeiH
MSVFGAAGPWLEWTGVAVFALTGALMAARKEMDPFGFAMLATVTGVGGGTARDVLLGRTPVFWIVDPTDVVICIVVGTLTFVIGPSIVRAAETGFRRRLILWADAVGLALFAVTGAERALAAGASLMPAIALGTMTATFGGIIRDILAGEPPLVLRREIYVTAAALGAGVFVVARMGGVEPLVAGLAGAACAFVLRALAILRGWSLPAFTAKPRGEA